MSVFIRIALRYLSGSLMAKGFLDADSAQGLANDAELIGAIEIGIGFATGAVTEGYYALARRFGWPT
jgi:hypothetical protein